MYSSNCRMISLLMSDAPRKKEHIVISELASKQILAELLQLCISTIDNVHEIITTTSALPGYEQNAKSVESSRKAVNQFMYSKLSDWNKIKEKLLLKILNIAIKAQGTGNCYEFAFYTQFLLEKNVKSELFRVKGQKNNHIFLVVNRDLDTPSDDYTEWNKEAFILDSYLKKIYLASEIPTSLRSCYYDSDEGLIHYLPFEFNQHKLDNNVMKEFIEDWQLLLTERLQAKTDNSDETKVNKHSLK